MMRDMLDERIEVHAPTCDWVVSSGQIVCNCVPPASEAAVIRKALDGGVPLLNRKERMARRKRAEKALATLEARVEVELELRKAAYERIAALEARLAEAGRALRRTVYIAEHLFQMVPQETWRDSGGDDMQGHYEGDYHVEKVREELAEIRAALPPESAEAVTGGKGGLSWRERTGIEPESAEG